MCCEICNVQKQKYRITNNYCIANCNRFKRHANCNMIDLLSFMHTISTRQYFYCQPCERCTLHIWQCQCTNLTSRVVRVPFTLNSDLKMYYWWLTRPCLSLTGGPLYHWATGQDTLRGGTTQRLALPTGGHSFWAPNVLEWVGGGGGGWWQPTFM